jgi:hypothetical protein
VKRPFKALLALGIFGSLLGATWYAAPHIAKRYVEQKYPGVTVGLVEIHLDRLELHDVDVTKTYGSAHLDTVTVFEKGPIEAVGGTASIQLDLVPEKKTSALGEGRKVTARDLHVEVLYDDSDAQFEGVRYENGQVCWDSATAVFGAYKNYDPCTVLACDTQKHAIGEMGQGCATADSLEASNVGLWLDLKRNLYGVPSSGDLQLEGLRVNPVIQRAEVGTATYGPFQAFNAVIAREGATTHLGLEKLTLSHPWLGKDPLTLDQGLAVTKGDNESSYQVVIGDVAAALNPETLEFHSKAKCSDWAQAMPVELSYPLAGIQWDKGSLEIDVAMRVPKVSLKHTCKAMCGSNLLVGLRKPFTYIAYDSKGLRIERTTGPGSRDWTYLPYVSKDVTTAVIALEDPGFPSHRGYIGQAFENSLKDNLATGKFLRGGSTITMQLAKNLWLYRDKTITRKLQEVLLAIALEDCFSKAEILELYLNVVEFGPDLYGIGPAARKYFGTSPTEVTTEQAFSLAMLLPSPRKGLPDKARVKKLMETLARMKVIPETMLSTEESLNTEDWE